MSQRGLIFGAAAAAYEQFRPGYPDAAVDVVLDYAERPVRAALEIGAGTGKATRAFARREIAVTATDPDPAMLVELRQRVPATVAAVAAAFERLPLDSTYDLVFAAGSLHWTQPAHRWSRIATLLVPGGVFANLGGPFELADPQLAAAVAYARSEVLPDDVLHAPEPDASDSPLSWPGNELSHSPLFTDIRQLEVARRFERSPDEYISYLGTVSAFLMLSDSDRQTAFANIRAVLPARVAITADLTVHLARLA